MRNIHLSDDGQNGIVGFRGPFGNASTPVVEGKNLLRGRILLKNNESVENLKVIGQQGNQDSADQNRSSVAQRQVQTTAKGDATIVCEEMADTQDCGMRADKEVAYILYDEVDGEVTLQGWLNGQGQLWWNDRLKVITVQSPLLLPNNVYPFMIKSVVHRQSIADGTTTSLLLCRADGLGGGAEPLWQSG
jgi:prophage tail gpP-like protein